MNSNDVKVVDISDVGQKIGDYVCPYCGVIMLPLSLAAMKEMALMLKFRRTKMRLIQFLKLWMKIQDNIEMRKRRTITLQKTIDETRKV